MGAAMSSSIARRREAKANRRKKQLAERRRQGQPESSLPAGVRRAARAPIERCLLQEDLFESGTGMLFLVRGTPETGLFMASFLLDPFCLGVKEVVLCEIESAEIDDIIAVIDDASPLTEVEPAYARKLLRELAAYARSLGLEPPDEYRLAESLFGTVSPDASDAQFEFGCEGRPLYIPGPSETRAQVRERLGRLRRMLGADGFDFEEVEEIEDALGSDEEDALDEYDPDIAPDPAEWLELDEDERLSQVQRYHRHAGIEPENDEVHAGLHVAVENQIAGGDPPVVAPALARLMAEGLDRHQAIHAIGCVLLEMIVEMAKSSTEFSNDAYSTAIERLTAEGWRRAYGEEGGQS